jgi:hypothetical protein
MLLSTYSWCASLHFNIYYFHGFLESSTGSGGAAAAENYVLYYFSGPCDVSGLVNIMTPVFAMLQSRKL